MATFGVLISNRSFFPDHLVLTAREKLLKALTEWGHDYVILSTEDTFMGETMTYEEAKKCADLFYRNRDKIDGVIICLPNFGDENGIKAALRDVNVPVLLQAYPDEIGKMDFASRRDAFCGKLGLCAVFKQMGFKFTSGKPFVMHPLSAAFEKELGI